MSNHNNSKQRPAATASRSNPPEDVQPDAPQFRFVQMQQQRPVAEMETDNVIHKEEYMPNHFDPDSAAGAQPKKQETNWTVTELRPVPAFYPLEKSSRLVEDDTAAKIATRLSECLRCLSIAANYTNDTATLLSSENVEMHLSLWKTPANSPQQGIVVELQRRTGDSIAFHRYARTILDAAMGLIEVHPDHIAAAGEDVVYSKKVQRLLKTAPTTDNSEHETAITAIEIAHGLLMKDRMDARMLGLESLCLLTDPRKTGYITAILTSHVVLLGSTQGIQIPGMEDSADEGPFQEIHQGILNLVQFSRIGDDDEHHYQQEHNTQAGDHDEHEMSIDAEQMTLLHNLALAVLANALDVIENPDRFEPPQDDGKPRARLRTVSSNEVANEFISKTEDLSSKEILTTLISELGKASAKPHNATLSAKCIGSLCRASDDAKKRAKELGAKQVVSTALDVGVRTHLKLETECQKVVDTLTRTASEEERERQRHDRDNDDDKKI